MQSIQTRPVRLQHSSKLVIRLVILYDGTEMWWFLKVLHWEMCCTLLTSRPLRVPRNHRTSPAGHRYDFHFPKSILSALMSLGERRRCRKGTMAWTDKRSLWLRPSRSMFSRRWLQTLQTFFYRDLFCSTKALITLAVSLIKFVELYSELIVVLYQCLALLKGQIKQNNYCRYWLTCWLFLFVIKY